jgi:hypothetical protein
MPIARQLRQSVPPRALSGVGISLLMLAQCAQRAQPIVRNATPALAITSVAAANSAGVRRAPVTIGAISCRAAATMLPLDVAWSGDAVQSSEFTVRLGPNGVRNRVVAFRFDPTVVKLALDIAHRDGEVQPWSLDDAPRDARIAFNAGQFTDAGPWGWVVHRGREWQTPGTGTLAGALVTDSSGLARVIDASEIAKWRSSGRVMEAVQSYPMLLGGVAQPPAALCDSRGGLDLTHSDTRLAIGTTADGQTLVVLTRYELPGGMSSRLPIGPTTPEMAEIMRRLGAERALMLDGGLSAQLLARNGTTTTAWPGVRRVPLAIVARD